MYHAVVLAQVAAPFAARHVKGRRGQAACILPAWARACSFASRLASESNAARSVRFPDYD
jgi:hypothetical protein